jgi:hypothetical protein
MDYSLRINTQNRSDMMEKLLVWKIYSTADVFGVKSYFSEDGRKSFSSAMLFRGLMGNYLE